jgi:hypothetical protein
MTFINIVSISIPEAFFNVVYVSISRSVAMITYIFVSQSIINLTIKITGNVSVLFPVFRAFYKTLSEKERPPPRDNHLS